MSLRSIRIFGGMSTMFCWDGSAKGWLTGGRRAAALTNGAARKNLVKALNLQVLPR